MSAGDIEASSVLSDPASLELLRRFTYTKLLSESEQATSVSAPRLGSLRLQTRPRVLLPCLAPFHSLKMALAETSPLYLA